MKMPVLTCVCCLLVTAGIAQWRTETLPLPDSLSGVSHPRQILYNPGNNTVFVAGDDSILVVLDGVTNRKIARIPLPFSVAGPMRYDAVDNKVYVLGDTAMAVVDAAANRSLRTVPIGLGLSDICHNPTMNRVYCSDYYGTITVIDCAADTVVARIWLRARLENICASPQSNKVYVMMPDSQFVAVIDCSTDSVIKAFYTGAGAYEMLYNPLNNRLYISEGVDEDVAVVDCERDSLVRWLPAGYYPTDMCLDTRDNKLYVADLNGMLTIVDCSADTLLGWRYTSTHSGIVYDSVDNLVYLALQYADSLAILDCRTDSIVAQVATDNSPRALAYDPRDNQVYVGGYDATVAALRGGTNEVLARHFFWYPVKLLACRPTTAELYCEHADSVIGVVSIAGQRLVRETYVGYDIDRLFYNEANDKLYCSRDYTSDQALIVIRCGNPDTLVRVEHLNPKQIGFCAHPAAGIVYCTGDPDWAITILDAEADTIIRRVTVGRVPRGLALSTELSRLYVSLKVDSAIVVLNTVNDSVIDTLPLDDPSDLLFVPDLNLLCAMHRGRRLVAVIDATTCEVLDVIPIADYISDFCYDRRLGKLYIAISNQHRVVPYDLETMRSLPDIDVPYPSWLELDTLTHRLYCGSSPQGAVTIIDCRSDSVMTTFPVENEYSIYPAWDQIHRRLFVSQDHFSLLTIITDSSTVGIASGPAGRVRTSIPTIVRGMLFLPATNVGYGASIVLLDITGRKVADLAPGANDVRHLSPGVYFLLSADDGAPSRISKVIVQR